MGEKFGRRQAGTEAISMPVALDALICDIWDGARRGGRMVDEGHRWCYSTAALARDPGFHTCLTVMQESSFRERRVVSRLRCRLIGI